MTHIDRRGFLRAAAIGMVAGGPLAALSARTADASTMVKRAFSPDYGPLSPVKDHTTGLELLKLPRGFEYLTHGWTGDLMSDGRPTPPCTTAWPPSSRAAS
ncbi:hypothetical protein [Nonomuraea recticatena]|uniref:hypothetical protein n=1 Tax=Nonomuraea recticatena TaxID=46178 RepID=UPI0036072C23